MDKLKAFVFDTNFIVQNQDLNEVVESLKEQYSVYVTRVSIDERIAQECRAVKAKFGEAEEFQRRVELFATIHFTKTFEQTCTFFREGMSKKYEALFGDHIIPFSKDEATFSAILERAGEKLPPFSDAKDASDKGFKDCLLWLSLLAYFKENGEDDVLFVTDDRSAFRNHIDFLADEFHSATGKTIEFKPNSFYKELLKQPESPPPIIDKIPDIETFRKEIAETIEGLRGVDYENYFGDPQWSMTFSTSTLFDKEYIKIFFENLQSNISNHFLETAVAASEIFENDGRITDTEYEIPMDKLEKALSIYQTILKKYPDYCEQFYEVAAKILNRNYVKPSEPFYLPSDDDDDLPF